MNKRQEPQLVINGLTKYYGSTLALNNISFEINKGDIVALIGASGSGKSTLINILSKTLNNYQGSIFLEGKDIQTIKNRKYYAKEIGVIRQQFDMVNELEVIHNVLAGKLHEWGFWKSLRSLVHPVEEVTALNALSEVGIQDKAYEITSSLSGGQQQRVAIARLIVQNPNIILADEPIASLDPARSEKVIQLLTHMVNEKGKTLITSMHSIEYVTKHFTRIIGIKDTQVAFDKNIEKISDQDLKTLYQL